MTQTSRKAEPSLNQKTNYQVNLLTRLDQKFDQAIADIRREIGEAKDATISAIKKPETWTDRFLDWWRAKDASWLGWVVILFLLAVAYSVGGARAA